MRGLIAARTADDGGRRDRRRHETYDKSLSGLPSADDHPRRRPTDRARLCGRNRRSFAYPPIARRRRLSWPSPKTVSVGKVDYTGGIFKCGDRRVRMLLYEAANVMLTRYKGQLKLKAGPSRSPSDQRCAKRESLWLAASRSPCMLCCGTEPSSHRHKPAPRDRRPNPAPMRSDALGREQTTAPILLQGPTAGRLRFQPSRPAPSLPHQVPNEHAENEGTRKRRHPKSFRP
jgi:hypothetical protein